MRTVSPPKPGLLLGAVQQEYPVPEVLAVERVEELEVSVQLRLAGTPLVWPAPTLHEEEVCRLSAQAGRLLADMHAIEIKGLGPRRRRCWAFLERLGRLGSLSRAISGGV